MNSHRAITPNAITEKSIMNADHTAPQRHVDILTNETHRFMNCVSISTLHNPCAPTKTPRKNWIFTPPGLDLTLALPRSMGGNKKYLEMLPLRSWHRQGRPPVQEPAPVPQASC